MVKYCAIYFKDGKQIFLKTFWATSYSDAINKAPSFIGVDFDRFEIEED